MNLHETQAAMALIPMPAKGIKEKTVLREYSVVHASIYALTNHIPDISRFIQRWYCVKDNTLVPTICPECGNVCGLAKQGYFMKYCSQVCRQVGARERAQIAGQQARIALQKPGALESRRIKSVATNMTRYGASNPMQNEDVKATLRANNLENYGVEHTLALKSTQDKIEATNLKRHGKRRPLQRPEINAIAQVAAKITWGNNWPTGHPFSDIIFRENVKDILIAKYGVENVGMLRNFRSKGEIEMFEYILSIFPDAIPTYRKEGGVELDVFVPSINTGFEYNGVYFHCDAFPNARNRHSEKRKHFLNRNIRVIQVWEDQWKTNKLVMQKFIENLSKSKKSIRNARDCVVSVVNTEATNTLLNRLHVQGRRGHATHRIGLYLNDELVSLMTLTKCPANVSMYGNNAFEITRFVNDGVRGAFSKLVSAFGKTNPNSTLYSFADLEIVDERKNVYRSNGFIEHHRLTPDYKYVVKGLRAHKFGFRQEELEKKNIPRVYDCGKICYIKKL